MANFDRQYRLAAGKAGDEGFEIGGGLRPLHINFSVEKADTNSQNTAKVTIWNLNDEHIAELNKDDCVVSLHPQRITTIRAAPLLVPARQRGATTGRSSAFRI